MIMFEEGDATDSISEEVVINYDENIDNSKVLFWLIVVIVKMKKINKKHK